MSSLRIVPLFGILWGVYNALLLTGVVPSALAQPLFSLTLVSGAVWSLTLSELLIALGVLALYIEILKATRTTLSAVIDHTVSTAVFIAFLIEFIIVEGAGNSTFLILGLMSLLDAIAGFTISIIAARRDIELGKTLD